MRTKPDNDASTGESRKRKFDDEVVTQVEEEFGTNYHCNGCTRDITTTVRIRCAECMDFDMCITCFSTGVEPPKTFHRKSHKYRVMEMLDFEILDADWGADEELKLVTAIEHYGLGNWEQVAEQVGTKNRLQCADHYDRIYIRSDTFPVPNMDWKIDRNKRLSRDRVPPRKVPKHERPPVSQPANHEILGFMPGRLEFEVEPENDAELMIKDLEFSDSDIPEETEMKMAMFGMYNAALDRRKERKRFVFDRAITDFKKLQQLEKKRSKEEKDLYQKMRVFAKMQTGEDFDEFVNGLLAEFKLREDVARLQEYRRMGITDTREVEQYERDKRDRELNRLNPYGFTGQYGSSNATPRSRAASILSNRTTPAPPSFAPTPSSQSHLHYAATSPPSVLTPPSTTSQQQLHQPQPAATGLRRPAAPLDISSADGLDLLTHNEQLLCATLRLFPKSYLVIKETILREFAKNGSLRRRECRQLIKIDVNKTARIYDFFVEMGWVRSKPHAPGALGGGGTAQAAGVPSAARR
ncbi:Transcriptional adapter ada2 [Thoreauomyces humboldtii]|nr:Transcriptional adapter ada2 [Thoreauomyces humboldtii]